MELEKGLNFIHFDTSCLINFWKNVEKCVLMQSSFLVVPKYGKYSWLNI